MSSLSLGLCAQLACLYEATARKPGNVHRYHDFADVTYLDFATSAAASAPVFDAAPGRRVGHTVLEAVTATRQLVATNTNLGIILLLAPLATARDRTDLSRVLSGLDVEDARLVYQAIRRANPGGLGEAAEQDVHTEPTVTLRDAMALAAERDGVARQYVTDFADVLEIGEPALVTGVERTGTLEGAILFCQLQLMAALPDSLIARKRGSVEAAEASERARHVLNVWDQQGGSLPAALAAFDAWLRACGHARNPGTTADLVTASLFVALREDMINPRISFPWPGGFHHG